MTTMSGPFPMSVNAGSFVNSRPTGEIAGSEGYLWYDGDRLGDGATGTVYVGREKTTGHLCAIKTFNAQARKRSKTVQNREFDILSKLRHVNIVKILAIEDELQVDSRVLVMELCTGGSLFSILEHPANRFGLNEAEFLLVVEHVSNGMKHLRDNGIIHRDLKPGNIMRYVTESGESIYKLVNFGAARELDDEEVFTARRNISYRTCTNRRCWISNARGSLARNATCGHWVSLSTTRPRALCPSDRSAAGRTVT